MGSVLNCSNTHSEVDGPIVDLDKIISNYVWSKVQIPLWKRAFKRHFYDVRIHWNYIDLTHKFIFFKHCENEVEEAQQQNDYSSYSSINDESTDKKRATSVTFSEEVSHIDADVKPSVLKISSGIRRSEELEEEEKKEEEEDSESKHLDGDDVFRLCDRQLASDHTRRITLYTTTLHNTSALPKHYTVRTPVDHPASSSSWKLTIQRGFKLDNQLNLKLCVPTESGTDITAVPISGGLSGPYCWTKTHGETAAIAYAPPVECHVEVPPFSKQSVHVTATVRHVSTDFLVHSRLTLCRGRDRCRRLPVSLCKRRKNGGGGGAAIRLVAISDLREVFRGSRCGTVGGDGSYVTLETAGLSQLCICENLSVEVKEPTSTKDI